MARRSSSGRVSAFRRTPLFAAIACALAQGALAGSFSVTNANDSGTGSLRKAIDDANYDCFEMGVTSSTITFFNGLHGPFAIKPSTPLPRFDCYPNNVQYNVSLDAVSQGVSYGAVLNSDPNGFNATLGTTLDGSMLVTGGVCGLEMVDNGYGGQLAVTGMEIINFNYGSSNTALCGNIYARGNRLAANNNGMQLRQGSIIGGGNPGDRNVIVGSSGGDRGAIELRGGSVSINNNFIGTPDGVSADLNYYGIFFDCCQEPTGFIGNNVIASSYANIILQNDSMSIQGNKIGVNKAGTALLGSASLGIAIYFSYGSSITGNTIAGADKGIWIKEGNGAGLRSGVRITDNRIGTTSDGQTRLGNNTGIYVESSRDTSIFGNGISGNANYGIWLSGSVNTSVQDNFIGTNYGGFLRVPNKVGVYLGLSNTATIGGNTISGNSQTGLVSFDASNITMTGNWVGTMTGGAGNLGNGSGGVILECGSNVTLTSNTISNNDWQGLYLGAISDSRFESNTIQGNTNSEVGVNGVELEKSTCSPPPPPSNVLGKRSNGRSTTVARPKGITPGSLNYSNNNTFLTNTITDNSGSGIYVLGGSNNTFGKNDIHSNRDRGILIESEAYGGAVGNRITKGSNYGNRVKNIELGSVTPNNLQARPVIRSAVRDTTLGTTTVTVDLTTGSGEYIIELFSNGAPGIPAGQNYLATSLDLNQASPGTFTYTFTLNETTSDNFSATAIHQDNGDTSEFADIFPVYTLPVPAADVMPTSIDFGDVVIGRQSSQGTISITSQGTGPYVINQLRDGICDTSATICSSGSFICSTNCSEGTPYSKGMSCTITASFAPTAVGAQTKTLALCDNTTASPRSLTFTGNGIVAPEVDIVMAPTTYYFGEVLVGAQSPSKSFTVTNMGTQPVYLGNVNVNPPDFVIAGNTCSSTLAGGASCATDVSFLPSGKGVVFGSLQVTGSNAPLAAARRGKVTGPTTNTVSATLQGSGVQFGDLRLPASIAFGARVLHSAPARQTVTINNTGNGTLSIGNISVAGPFTLGNPCPATLASGASCVITLDFNPATLGTFNGTLTVVSDAPGGNRSIPITAQVIADARPVVTVNPTIVGFGQRTIGTTSPARRVTITNEGAETAILGALAFVQPQENATEFSVASSNCTGTLAPQATCFADIVFKALGFGERNGRMLVPSNAPDSPQSVTLGGTGCRPFTASSNRSGRDPCAP